MVPWLRRHTEMVWQVATCPVLDSTELPVANQTRMQITSQWMSNQQLMCLSSFKEATGEHCTSLLLMTLMSTCRRAMVLRSNALSSASHVPLPNQLQRQHHSQLQALHHCQQASQPMFPPGNPPMFHPGNPPMFQQGNPPTRLPSNQPNSPPNSQPSSHGVL